ncbi:unnamed protein product [Staurois parvus]|uniref:Uncharacterized protein n=1 Tax=Staurois parvus TaxID=386267 RepID=A0ABN9HFE8_9NEOB|nr:unnamed protein product [Staurois parvus]
MRIDEVTNNRFYNGLILCIDPDISDPPILPLSPSYLLLRHMVWRHSAHAQFGVYC